MSKKFVSEPISNIYFHVVDENRPSSAYLGKILTAATFLHTSEKEALNKGSEAILVWINPHLGSISQNLSRLRIWYPYKPKIFCIILDYSENVKGKEKIGEFFAAMDRMFEIKRIFIPELLSETELRSSFQELFFAEKLDKKKVCSPLLLENIYDRLAATMLNWIKGEEIWEGGWSLTVGELKNALSDATVNPTINSGNEIVIPTRIDEIVDFLRMANSNPELVKETPIPTQKVKKKRRIFRPQVLSMKKTLAVGLALVFVVLSTAYFLSFFTLSETQKQVALQLQKKGKVNDLMFMVDKASWLEEGRGALAKLIGQAESEAQISETLKIFKNFAQALDLLKQSQDKLVISLQNILRSTPQDDISAVHEADKYLSRTYDLFSNIGIRLTQDETFVSSRLGGEVMQKGITDFILNSRRTLGGLQVLGQILESSLGYKQNIGIILQDAGVPRPSGGQITAVLWLTIDKGKILNSEVFTASALEQRMVGRVTPPQDLGELKPERGWEFRDATWQGDFSKNAAQVAWFLQKQLSESPDIVMAINTQLLPKIIDNLKGIKIDEQFYPNGETWLLERKRKSSISTQELEVLDAKALSVIFSQFQQQPVAAWQSYILQGLEQHEILLSSNNVAITQGISALKWDGNRSRIDCPNQFNQGVCQLSYLEWDELGTGQARLGDLIERGIQHEIEITLNTTQHRRVFKYHLSANATSSYQAQLRITLDKNVDLESVRAPNKPNSSGMIIIPFSVSPGETKSIVLEYSASAVKSGESLVWVESKQTGIPSVNFGLRIKYPSSMSPKTISSGVVQNRLELIFDKEIVSESLFGVEFF